MKEKIKIYLTTEDSLEEISQQLGVEITPNTTEVDFENKTSKESKKNHVKRKKFNDKHWKEMDFPEYFYGEEIDYVVKFELSFNNSSRDIIERIFKTKIKPFMSFIKYPYEIQASYQTKVIGDDNNQGLYPIYIVSKGRADVCLTCRNFIKMGIDFYIVIEEQEFEEYSKHYRPERLLILPKKYKEEYETLDNKESLNVGPGAARNFAWDHSIENGFDFHWVFDDNVSHFYYYNDNQMYRPWDRTIFNFVELLITNYSNIGIAGLNYETFIMRKGSYLPYILNTRIYSMLLIRNDLPFRWKGRYNEDTILSLNVLEAGYCTLQTNFLFGKKAQTQSIKGGNTEEFYKKEGTLPKSFMLWNQFPDRTKIVFKFGRIHHQVRYDYDNSMGEFKLKAKNHSNLIFDDCTEEECPYKSSIYARYGLNMNALDTMIEEDFKMSLGQKRSKSESRQEKYKGYVIKDINKKCLILYGEDVSKEELKLSLGDYDTYVHPGKYNVQNLAIACFEQYNLIDYPFEGNFEQYVNGLLEYVDSIMILGNKFVDIEKNIVDYILENGIKYNSTSSIDDF